MSNSINGLNGSPTTVGTGRTGSGKEVATGEVASAGTSAGGNAAAGNADTGVQITDTAARLLSLEKAIREMPAVDQARVDQLRAAIEQGKYTVQPQHIASQLMQFEDALRRLAGGKSSAQPDTPKQPQQGKK